MVQEEVIETLNQAYNTLDAEIKKNPEYLYEVHDYLGAKLIGEGKNEFERLFDYVTDLIEKHEEGTIEFVNLQPNETLKALMELNNLQQKDLLPELKNKSKISELLSGKRVFSKNDAIILSEKFNVSTDLFIKLK